MGLSWVGEGRGAWGEQEHEHEHEHEHEQEHEQEQEYEHEQEHEDGSRSTTTEAGLHFLSVCCGGVCGVWGGASPPTWLPRFTGAGGGFVGSGIGEVPACEAAVAGAWCGVAAG